MMILSCLFGSFDNKFDNKFESTVNKGEKI